MATIKERTQLLLKASESSHLKQIIRLKCKNDPLYWFDWFAVTFDPRPDPITNKPIGTVPFDLYPFQRELVPDVIEHIKTGKDLLIEKSRDMGVSWVILSVFFYLFLFEPGFSGRVGSRNINEVDRPGDMSTLFEKLRELLRNTPQFLMPYGFNPRSHNAYVRLINPANGASIVGETANASFGRSGRNTAVLMDEHAFWDAGDAAWESCGQTTQCRISISTPNGSNNRFARMANRKIPDQPDKRTLHWRLHPLHDEAWYEKQKRRYTKSGLAREVDISYALSLEGKVFEMFEYQLHVKTVTPDPAQALDNPQNLYTPNPNLPIIVSFDFGRCCAALFSQVDDYYNIDVFHEIVLMGTETNPGGSTEELALMVLKTMDQYDSLHPGKQASKARYTYRFTGDPAGKVLDWKVKIEEAFSDDSVLANKGLAPIQRDKIISVKEREKAGVSLLQTIFNTRFNGRERIYIHNPDKTPLLIQALQGEYRYRTDQNGDVTDTITQVHPYEDVVDCLRYTALQFANTLPNDRNTRKNKNAVVESGYEFLV